MVKAPLTLQAMFHRHTPAWSPCTVIQWLDILQFNARSETVAEKTVFSRLLQRQRCVVLFDGFYEWKKVLYLDRLEAVGSLNLAIMLAMWKYHQQVLLRLSCYAAGRPAQATILCEHW